VNLGIDVVLFENFDETVAQAALLFRAGSIVKYDGEVASLHRKIYGVLLAFAGASIPHPARLSRTWSRIPIAPTQTRAAQ